MDRPDFAEFYAEPRFYDLNFDHLIYDVPFYQKQIDKFGQPVLEIAAGTGRITIPLAENKVDITGLDLLETMLSRAQKKAEAKNLKINWVQADCRDFELNRKFKVIFFPANSIGHIHTRANIDNCFQCIKRHLHEEGRFILQMFNPNFEIIMRDPKKRFPVAEFFDPELNCNVKIDETGFYDRATQILYRFWHYQFDNNRPEETKELRIRMFYPKELDALLHYNGLIIENKYGDYEESKFGSESPYQIFVCKI